MLTVSSLTLLYRRAPRRLAGPRADGRVRDQRLRVGKASRVTVTQYYAFRGQHPRSPLAPSATRYPARPGEGAATRMGRVTEEVLVMLREWRDRTAELDASRRVAHFAVGDEILLDTEHNPPPPPPRV